MIEWGLIERQTTDYVFDMDLMKMIMQIQGIGIDDFAYSLGITKKAAERFFSKPEKIYKCELKAIRVAIAIAVDPRLIVRKIGQSYFNWKAHAVELYNKFS